MKPLFDRWARQRAFERDVSTLTQSALFDADLFRSPFDDPSASREFLIRQYLSDCYACRAGLQQHRILRRPMAGFHPLVYASETPAFDYEGFDDPFCHFIRSDQPQGPWQHAVMLPDEDVPPPAPLKIAVHAHMYYVELLPDLIFAMRANTVVPDLLLTTTSVDKKRELENFCRYFDIKPKMIAVLPNKGRNIWPLVSLLQEGTFDLYDLVLHVHGKRSPGYDLGDMWRRFLWSHLVGGSKPSMNIIAAAFLADPTLGLMFAEEPYLDGWEENLASCTALAKAMQIPTPLPYHVDYPQGAMFWFRPHALAPLLKAGITLDQIPTEPLPHDDGTILHAIERMIPFVVTKAGYNSARIYLRGCTR